MSVINLFRNDMGVHLFTDGASYRGGEIAALGPKVFTAPHWPAIIATRGDRTSRFWLGSILTGMFATFDDLVSGLDSGAFMAAHIAYEAVAGAAARTEMVLAGWSAERLDFEAYYVRSFETDDGGPAANRLTVLPSLVFGPRFDCQPEITHDSSESDLCRAMVSAIEVQRQEYGSIGGFVQVTSLTYDGIAQRILHRWNGDIDAVRERKELGQAA